jgi:AcrR family transcriptional regulator
VNSSADTEVRPGGTKAPSSAEPRRIAILNAAAHAIAAGGIADLRVEQVAAEAGVSVALIYYHFGDRMGLAKAAFILASERAPSTELLVASDKRSGFKALEGALMAELDDRQEVRDAAIVWGEAAARAAYDQEFQPIVGEITRSWVQAVRQGITRGVNDGSIRADIDPEATAQVLVTLVDGLCIRWLAEALPLATARALLRGAIRENLLPPVTP